MSARALPAAVPCARRRPAAAIESAFVRLRPALPWVHAVMAVVFLGIIVVPALLPAPAGDATPFDDFPTFAGWLLWGMWFPLVFLSVIVSGRSWCGLLCPMGAASEWANRLGRQRAIPAWLRWEGTPVVSFLVVTILGQTLGVRDYAGAALEVFGGTMLAAIAIGWLYGRRKRAWCRHACPIGLLLGVFSRLGAVDFAPRSRLRNGVRENARQTEAGICPTMIDLARKDESRHCIECFRCVNPTARGGIHLELRRPGAEIESIRDHNPNPAEAWFLFLGTGVALGGFLWPVLPQIQNWRQAAGEWAVAHGWMGLLEPGPAWLMSVHPLRHEVFLWLDFALICGTMLGTMAVLAAVLAGLTAATASLARRAGGDARFTELAYQVAPVAMVSLVIGLGGKLFEPLALTPLGPAGIHAVKGGLVVLALLWSVWLGWRILARQGVAPRLRWLPLLPGLLGSAVVGLGWWPAIFGL